MLLALLPALVIFSVVVPLIASMCHPQPVRAVVHTKRHRPAASWETRGHK